MKAAPVAEDLPLAALAAQLLAVDPVGLSGAVLWGGEGPVRQGWLQMLRQSLPPGCPWLRMPHTIQDDALLGGLDLNATLQHQRPVHQAGLLARAAGGVVLLPMAERMSTALAGRLAGALDARAPAGQAAHAGFALLALVDPSPQGDTPFSVAVSDRLAFCIDLDTLDREHVDLQAQAAVDADHRQLACDAARKLLPHVAVPDAILTALCQAGAELGALSLRATSLSIRAARAHAAWCGRREVDASDAAQAARLVLAPRGRPDISRPTEAEPSDPAPGESTEAADAAPPPAGDQPPPQPPPAGQAAPPPSPAPPPDAAADAPTPEDDSVQPATDQGLPEMLLEAALACLPPDTLLRLAAGGAAARGAAAAGVAGAVRASLRHGRPIGSRPGEPERGARLHVIDTLRAAAPWQGVRRRERALAAGLSVATGAGTATSTHAASPTSTSALITAGTVSVSRADRSVPSGVNDGVGSLAERASRDDRVSVTPSPARPRLDIRRSDFRVVRREQRSETTTVFVVDASGSAAMHRLAEAKGAVELLLAQCYVRRDSVALISFRRGSTPVDTGARPQTDKAAPASNLASLDLPPTRALARAKRSLAALTGGGGTPLASGVAAAARLTADVLRRGGTPVLVFLTDGRANLDLAGRPGRPGALADALQQAQLLAQVLGSRGGPATGAGTGRGLRGSVLVVDTSPPVPARGGARTAASSTPASPAASPVASRPGSLPAPSGAQSGAPATAPMPASTTVPATPARALAEALGAAYLVLPDNSARQLSSAVSAWQGLATG